MTNQLKEWKRDFGNEYTKRNNRTPKMLDELYRSNIGMFRTSINKEFLDFLNRDSNS